MTDTPAGFMEDKLDPGLPAMADPAFVVALIPFEETTTYKKGTREAPEAIVEASGHIELWDETLEIDASRLGIETRRPGITDLESITNFARELRGSNPRTLPGFIGGEHSITPALIEGWCRGEFGVVWIDAHADLRPSYLGSAVNHACAARNTAPMAPIVQIGVRTLAEEEACYLKETDRVRCFSAWDDGARRAIAGLPDTVYLSIDADGFAPEVVRAVGTPEPGGLYWHEVMDIVATLFREKRVTAFDVVELCPDGHDVASTFIMAKLVYKIISHHAHFRTRRKHAD